jgi:hypothetical protein
MRRIATIGVLLLLLLSSVPTLAQHQDNKLEPPDLEDYRRWGFLRVRPGFELSRLGYDSNILSTSTGDPVSDVTATLSPRLDGLILFGSAGFLTFREKYGYTLYLENSDQNFWNNEFTARATVPFGGIGVFSEISIDDLQSRPVDQEDIRTQSQFRDFGLGVILQPGWRTEIEVARHTNRWRYEDPESFNVSERLDRDVKWTGIDVSHRLRGRTRALLKIKKEQIEFLAPFNSITGPIERDTTEWNKLVGVRLGRGSSVVGQLLLGRGTIDADDPSLEDLSETIGEIDATWVAGSHTRIRLTARRYPDFAVSEGNAYYLDTSGSLRGVHYFTNLLGGEVIYRRGRLDFPEASTPPTRRDETRHIEIGIRLRVFNSADGRRVEYSATVGRYRRESNLSGFDQDRNTFGFGAVLGF